MDRGCGASGGAIATRPVQHLSSAPPDQHEIVLQHRFSAIRAGRQARDDLGGNHLKLGRRRIDGGQFLAGCGKDGGGWPIQSSGVISSVR